MRKPQIRYITVYYHGILWYFVIFLTLLWVFSGMLSYLVASLPNPAPEGPAASIKIQTNQSQGASKCRDQENHQQTVTPHALRMTIYIYIHIYIYTYTYVTLYLSLDYYNLRYFTKYVYILLYTNTCIYQLLYIAVHRLVMEGQQKFSKLGEPSKRHAQGD